MSTSPDNHSSNIHIKSSEQRLDRELNNITPVIGTVIKSLFNATDSSTGANNTLPIASQILAAFPQLHSVIQNINDTENIPSPIALGTKLLKDNKIQDVLNNEKFQKTIDQSLVQFDSLIETPLVQQLLNTMNADPNQIKTAVHMHNATVHQRLTAFEPIVNAVCHCCRVYFYLRFFS